ncbi:MAG TPA: glycosyltransferase [Mycobacteriales bacterium]|nr:glycosyltransferase [Mycobacteriales bacterium]
MTRVAVLHRAPHSGALSGEHLSAIAGIEALRSAGHHVVELNFPTGLLDAPKRLVAELRSHDADILIVDKWFPGGALTGRLPVPVILRVHNFMPICTAGTLSLGGELCTRCISRPWLPAVVHKCYRGSRTLSIPAASLQRWQRSRGFLQHADVVVFPTETARDYFVSAVPTVASRSRVVPHFVPAPPQVARTARSRSFMYVGQLEAYKGVLNLLGHWPDHERLLIAGDGSLRTAVRDYARSKENIDFLGLLQPEAVYEHLSSVTAVVVPSATPETFGRVHAEACAVGTPTIALAGTAVAAEVQRLATGTIIPTLDEIEEALSGPLPTEDHLRGVFHANYTEAAWTRSFTEMIKDLTYQQSRPEPA